MLWYRTAVVLALAGLAPLKTAGWSWRGEAPLRGELEVNLVRGSIRVERGEGNTVELVARRIGRQDDPRSVRMAVRAEHGRLLLSVVYPTRRLPGRGWLPLNPETGRTECLPEDPRSDFWYSDVRVELVVRVPRGVRVRAAVLDGRVIGPPDLLLRRTAGPSSR